MERKQNAFSRIEVTMNNKRSAPIEEEEELQPPEALKKEEEALQNENTMLRQGIEALKRNQSKETLKKPLRKKSFFLLRLLAYSASMLAGILFYGMLSVSLSHDVSLIDGGLHLMHLKKIPPRQISGRVYPVVSKYNPKDVHFYNLNFNNLIARPLVNSLEPSFEFHLKTGTQFGCLCMHQLEIHTDKLYRVCAIRNRDDMYLLVNPNIVGYSNEKQKVEEVSSLCENPVQQKERFKHIFLEWSEPPRGHRMYSRFESEEALCIQQALEEMELGRQKYCSNEK